MVKPEALTYIWANINIEVLKMGKLINEFLNAKEFKKRNRKRSSQWQLRRTNILLEFLKYAEFKKIERLKNIDETVYSAYINRLNRLNLKKSTINRYKNIIKRDLLGHFKVIK